MRAQTSDGGERAVLRLLASGRLGEVAALLSKQGRRDLAGLVAVTDARARGLAIDVPEVEAVVEQVEREEPPDGRLRFWAQAVLAERLLLEIDGSAFLVAQRALDELDRCQLPPRQPLALRYARARLNRVAGLAWSVVPDTADLASQRRLHDGAVAELLACNFVDEVHVTRGLDAGLTVAVAEEDILENYARLHDARVAVDDDPASMWPPMLDVFVAIAAFEAGDLRAALQAFERIESLPHVHTRVKGLAAFGRAFFRIITGGASPQAVAAVEAALSDVRRRDPRIAGAWHAQLAQTLADMRSPWADHFARLDAELPPIGPVHARGRELLRLRISALGAASPGADEAIEQLEALAAAGYRRRSARQALRLAHDMAWGGDGGSARLVHAWGADRLPEQPRLTVWERWWARPVKHRASSERSPFGAGGVIPSLWERWSQAGGAPVGAGARAGGGDRAADPGADAGQSPPGRVAVRVLTPALEVEVGGELVPMRDTVAKLLVALAIAHPEPLHVEQVAGVLWPDASLASARRRLNTVLYRARQLAAPAALVHRARDLVSLRAAGVDVDLLAFRRGLQGDPQARVRALAGVRGNLCQAQFPYDEPFLDERHRFIGTWLAETRELVAAGLVEPSGLRAASRSLGLDPRDLDDLAN